MTVWQIVTTLPSREAADKLAAALVEGRLAACVQVDGPIQSCYRWQGAVTSEAEWRCTIKTSESRLDDCMRAVREQHPYEVPEVLAAPAVRADEAYAAWVAEQTTVRG